jgi:hypothetical protein
LAGCLLLFFMQARFDRIEWLLESQQLHHITSEGPPFACDSQHQRFRK